MTKEFRHISRGPHSMVPHLRGGALYTLRGETFFTVEYMVCVETSFTVEYMVPAFCIRGCQETEKLIPPAQLRCHPDPEELIQAASLPLLKERNLVSNTEI